MHGAPLILIDVSKEPTDGLSPLKAALGAISVIYTNHKVCLPFLLATV